MTARKEKSRLGEMLLQAGLISKNQLNLSLANQREWGGKIGTILVNMGFIKEEKLAQFLSHQLNIPSIDISSIRIKRETVKLIPKEMAEKYMLIPVAHQLRKGVTTILLAMSDPLDLRAIDEIQFSTNIKVKAGIAPEGAIWRAIQIHYYDNKSISPKLNTTKDPIKINISEVDEKLEIFRGREETPVSNHDDETFADLLVEIRAFRNLLVRKGVMSSEEFLSEIDKIRNQ